MEESDFKYYELIEAYFENRLSKTEREDFESRMKYDTQLQEEVELYKIVVDGIKAKAEKEQLKEKLTNLDNQMDSNPSSKNNPKKKRK